MSTDPPGAPTTHRLQIEDAPAERRLDVWLAAHLPLSRARIQGLIEAGCVTLEGRVLENASRPPPPRARLVVTVPAAAPAVAEPQDIPLHVLYEDSDLVIIDKPPGLVVHPAPGHASGTLVNALLHHCRDLAGIGGTERPGIVHRLDRHTSGAMVIAKHDQAHQALVSQFQSRSITKTYLALTHGHLYPAEGRIETRIGRSPHDRKRMAVLERGGRQAISHYRTSERFPTADAALLEVRIETGRMHQIRVHLQHLGTPVLGDPIYGNRRRDRLVGLPSDRQMLHAWRLEIRHPTRHTPLCVEAPPPEDFTACLERLRAAG